jgi:nucleoid-associated protein YgaU
MPVTAAVRVIATVAVVAAAYAAAASVSVGLAAAAVSRGRERSARRLLGAVVPVLRRAIVGGFGLVITTVDPHPLGAGAPPPATVEAGQETGVATMRALGDLDVLDALDASGGPSGRPVAEPTWTIRSGDHLWGLAQDALRDAAGQETRDPTDAEVGRYVGAVVDRNRATFVVSGHPDLVLPGQVFVRPPIT